MFSRVWIYSIEFLLSKVHSQLQVCATHLQTTIHIGSKNWHGRKKTISDKECKFKTVKLAGEWPCLQTPLSYQKIKMQKNHAFHKLLAKTTSNEKPRTKMIENVYEKSNGVCLWNWTMKQSIHHTFLCFSVWF